ncbi:hypothetical protein COV19_07000 [Candidatus Woesearchaeota archaeon CG10_big_fil_rev_8_21_14_0_10_44_13]|nr:MAG: hypothetical protein COV19_07000 [Candidatus Woesearchaeota archaeon CG10_big_fil_rev_8_21_14_0_10_44_13]
MASEKKAGRKRITINAHTPLKDILELGSVCRKCGHCCSHGSGFLTREDHRRIAEHLRISENKLKEKYLEEIEKFNTRLWRPRLKKGPGKENLPYGKCVFLMEKGGQKLCRIHGVKPLQCRIGNCTKHGEKLTLWFTLNYFLNENDPESVRQYATYLKSGGKTLKGAELNGLVKDKGKLDRILSYEILR